MTTDDIPRYETLLAAVRRLLPCDAAALLRLEGETLLPEAIDGLAEEARNRRFALADHPRLARFVESPQPLRLPADCGLPDPYDGLVEGMPDILPVHDCLAAPLRVDGRLWGVLTLDAMTPDAFSGIDARQIEAVVDLVTSGVASVQRVEALRARQERELAAARALPPLQVGRELVGKSAPVTQLLREIDTVAGSDLSVLILGETGVGKELVAQRLHERSQRAQRPLVHVNCAALPESLAESELFGHRKGAFTGAVANRAGKFELADGGSLFLDEVGELPLTVQAKLLRALQSGEIQRPGSDARLQVDVRVIAATNRDLRGEVAAGRFRADLYHRLSVFPIAVPPLRERGRDLLALAGGFLEENQQRLGTRNFRLTATARDALLAYAWPGNVRELEHVMSRAALRALAEQSRDSSRGQRWIGIDARHLALEPAALPASATPASTAAPESAAGRYAGLGLREALEAFQREWVAEALRRHDGNLAAAARDAGMDRGNFHRLVKRLGLLVGGDS